MASIYSVSFAWRDLERARNSRMEAEITKSLGYFGVLEHAHAILASSPSWLFRDSGMWTSFAFLAGCTENTRLKIERLLNRGLQKVLTEGLDLHTAFCCDNGLCCHNRSLLVHIIVCLCCNVVALLLLVFLIHRRLDHQDAQQNGAISFSIDRFHMFNFNIKWRHAGSSVWRRL